MTKQNLTQERLKELVNYDPLTGIFTRLVDRVGCAKVWDVMGTVNTWGYLQARVDVHLYVLHRLAFLYMTGAFPPEQSDHINHKRTDNRWANLRPVSHTENLHNQSIRTDNTSGQHQIRLPR